MDLVADAPAQAAFRETLAAWFGEAARDLPWRRERTVYGTLVSELMLQQTQVKTVLPYYARWMARWPGFAELAAANEEEVLRMWEGLGYYRRARALHEIARQCAQMLARGESLPSSAEAWQSLKGIGPYTAAAIASQCLGEAVPVIDGNVVRVLARLTADGTEFRDSAMAQRHFRELAHALLDPDEPGRHNEAMMELGATVCRRSQPLCGSCPVRSFCRAYAEGDVTRYPVLKRAKTIEVTRERLWISGRRGLLLQQAGANSRRLAGVWELPLREMVPPAEVEASPLARKKRAIARERITEVIYAAQVPENVILSDGLHWIPWDDLGELTLSGPHRRWVEELRREWEDGGLFSGIA